MFHYLKVLTVTCPVFFFGAGEGVCDFVILWTALKVSLDDLRFPYICPSLIHVIYPPKRCSFDVKNSYNIVSDGESCDPPCQHGGRCVVTCGGNQTCECLRGFGGQYCEDSKLSFYTHGSLIQTPSKTSPY